jgi:prenyltransferase beta subunit
LSLRLQMRQVARLAPRVLGDSTELVTAFLQGQRNPDGGFRNRAGESDLYYTVFGLESLHALQAPPESGATHSFLQQAQSHLQPDLIYCASLARCAASASSPILDRDGLAAKLETFRTRDGGFHPRGGDRGSAYGAFLAVGAYQDLQVELPDSRRLVQSLKRLETHDGAWANEAGMASGSTNATAAAVLVLSSQGMPLNPCVGDWLLSRFHVQGGFVAAPATPAPDLLSTATALHALAALDVPLAGVKEATLDFVDTLWSNTGGFHGHWADDDLDCEYAFYGLLALGHLSL